VFGGAKGRVIRDGDDIINDIGAKDIGQEACANALDFMRAFFALAPRRLSGSLGFSL